MVTKNFFSENQMLSDHYKLPWPQQTSCSPLQTFWSTISRAQLHETDPRQHWNSAELLFWWQNFIRGLLSRDQALGNKNCHFIYEMRHAGLCLQFQVHDTQTSSTTALSLSGSFHPLVGSLCGFDTATILLAEVTTEDFIPGTSWPFLNWPKATGQSWEKKPTKRLLFLSWSKSPL